MQRERFPTWIIAIIAVVVVVAVVMAIVFAYLASTNPYGYGGYGGYYGGMMGGFGGWGMLIFMPIGLVIVVVVIYAIWRGVTWGTGCGDRHYGYYGSSADRENAFEILRQRYAKGEISKEQYDQMRRDLS